MKRSSLHYGVLVASLSILMLVGASPAAGVVFSYDFEAGQGNWNIDNGIWEVGTPTSGPNGCHGGRTVQQRFWVGIILTTRIAASTVRQLPSLL
jgi:hypothetical protein